MTLRTCFTLVFLIPLFLQAQQKEICFTYDDLPVVSYGINDSTSQIQLINNLIQTLTNNKVPAIGFVNEIKLFENGRPISFQIDMLRNWNRSGLALGNHSYSHFDYNNTPFADFTNDILKGEKITHEILSASGTEIKFFRHPYLHTGQTKDRADSLNAFLQLHQYTIAPVTIDNDDYLFALAYKRAKTKKDTTLANQIGRDYVIYMEKKLHYFEKLADFLFNRPIKHILLLHASQLNSDYTDELIQMCSKNSYKFISLDDVLKDPAYETPITVFGKWGISWLERWAMSGGKGKEILKEDPPTPEYIVKLAQ